MAVPDPLLSLAGIVAAYGLPRSTIKRALYRGQLPCIKLGGRGAKVWIRRSALEAWLASHEVR